MPRDTLDTRSAHPVPWVAAQPRTRRGRILAAACTAFLARLQGPETPHAAAAWMVARLGIALFLLAAAGRVGHAGLLSRTAGQ